MFPKYIPLQLTIRQNFLLHLTGQSLVRMSWWWNLNDWLGQIKSPIEARDGARFSEVQHRGPCSPVLFEMKKCTRLWVENPSARSYTCYCHLRQFWTLVTWLLIAREQNIPRWWWDMRKYLVLKGVGERNWCKRSPGEMQQEAQIKRCVIYVGFLS